MLRYYPKDFKATKYSDSRAIRDMLGKPELCDVLRNGRKRQQFFEVVKEVGTKTAITTRTMRTVLARCRWESRLMDRKQSLTVAKSFGIRSLSKTEIGRDAGKTENLRTDDRRLRSDEALGTLPQGSKERLRLLDHFLSPNKTSGDSSRTPLAPRLNMKTEKGRGWLLDK